MTTRIIIPVAANDPVPLIDEDFDVIAIELPMDHEWSMSANDNEEWSESSYTQRKIPRSEH
jgi:hypothetical protein